MLILIKCFDKLRNCQLLKKTVYIGMICGWSVSLSVGSSVYLSVYLSLCLSVDRYRSSVLSEEVCSFFFKERALLLLSLHT
jgi:hypothetical protein